MKGGQFGSSGATEEGWIKARTRGSGQEEAEDNDKEEISRCSIEHEGEDEDVLDASMRVQGEESLLC